MVDRIVEYDAGGEADRRDQGHHRDRVVLPGPLPGPAGHARRPPGRGARPDDGGLRRQAARVRRPDRAVRRHRRRPLQAHRRARATCSGSRSRWRSSAALRQGPRRRHASTARSPARATSFIIPPEGVLAMSAHRVLRTSTATLPRWRPSGGDQEREADVVLVAGDLVLNGPEPARSTTSREMETDGRDRRPGQHRHRGRRLRLRGGLPLVHRRRAGHVQAAAEWAHDALDDEHLAWLRRLPAERRVRIATTRSSSSATPRPAPRRRLRPGPRPVGHHRAHVPHRRPRHLLRPHPPARGPRVRLEDHRQRRLRGLRLRWRPDRVLGARRHRRRAR